VAACSIGFRNISFKSKDSRDVVGKLPIGIHATSKLGLFRPEPGEMQRVRPLRELLPGPVAHVGRQEGGIQ
jgi:hypothetical protein